MEDQYVGRLTSRMEVRDVLGYKIGTIARVYRDEHAALQLTAAGNRDVDARPSRPGVMEVKTGLMGLGPHLYIPVTEITEVTEDSVFLAKNKDEVVRERRQKPEFFGELA
jgi:hypothetical protein